MNVDQYKDKLGKIKTSVWYKNVLGEILLTTLKEKAMIFVYGTGLTKNKQNKKVGYIHEVFTKTSYWGAFSVWCLGVYETTNPYSKNPHAPYVAENEADFFCLKK